MLKLRIPRLSAAVLLRRMALSYLIVWVLSPPLAYGASWRVLALMSMSIWLAVEFRSPRSVLIRPNLPILGCVAFTLYTLAIEWLIVDSGDINRHFQVWIMFFFLLVGESQRRRRDDEAKFCFWVISIVLPIWSITTLWGIETISNDVARTISRSSDEARMLSEQGIGGFGFVYSLVPCLPFLTHLAFNHNSDSIVKTTRWRRFFPRLLIWTNFALTTLLVLRAGYSIALILSASSILGVFMLRSRRALPLAISVTLTGLLVFASSIMIDPALQALSSITPGTEYEAKINDVRNSLKSDENVGTLAGRTERYGRSFQVFLENPITGSLTLDGVGGHSAIIDRYAQYGIGFGTLFLYLLAFVPLRAVRDRRLPIGLTLAFLIVAIGYPMLNTAFSAWGLVLYVFSNGAFAALGTQQDTGHPTKDIPHRAPVDAPTGSGWIPQ